LSRYEVLKKLESTLETFLQEAVSPEKMLVDGTRTLATLDEITEDSLRGRYVNNRLSNWFSKNGRLLESGSLNEADMTRVANFLGSIKTGLDDSDPESKKLSEKIDDWRDRGVVPKRKLILKLKPKTTDKNLLKEFMNLLAKESQYINSGEFEDMHLLSALDDILKSAELKDDRMYIHLAGTMIYYLKSNGYKVDPFVKRLKDIENNKRPGGKP
jgi:hypothetical protein